VQKAAKGYSPALLRKMIDATTPLLANTAGFGHLDVSAWQSFADWMLAKGALTKPVSAATAATNDYLPR
jgi:hypothetical protein